MLDRTDTHIVKSVSGVGGEFTTGICDILKRLLSCVAEVPDRIHNRFASFGKIGSQAIQDVLGSVSTLTNQVLHSCQSLFGLLRLGFHKVYKAIDSLPSELAALFGNGGDAVYGLAPELLERLNRIISKLGVSLLEHLQALGTGVL